MHFPLHPETPPEGRSLEELFAGRDVDAEAMYQQMKGRMDAEGLLYERRTHTYNSRLAQELGTWADTLAGDGAIHDALFRAYFVDARNIGDADILVGLAESAGLPADEARDVIAERRFKDFGGRGLGEVPPVRRHRRPHLRRRGARRRRCPAVRDVGPIDGGRGREAERGRRRKPERFQLI